MATWQSMNDYYRITSSSGSTATIKMYAESIASLPKPPSKPETPLQWLDRRVDEMRVKL